MASYTCACLSPPGRCLPSPPPALFGLQIERTQVCKNTLNPVWNERMWLLVQVRGAGSQM